MPSCACRFRNAVSGASFGVKLRSGGSGKRLNGPKTWQCESQAPDGSASAGLREVYGSRAAKVPGSQNLAGIENPAADAMLDRIADATSRADLTTACRALDRVLRAGRYWVPMWYSGTHRLALWDLYGRPRDLHGITRMRE